MANNKPTNQKLRDDIRVLEADIKSLSSALNKRAKTNFELTAKLVNLTFMLKAIGLLLVVSVAFNVAFALGLSLK